MAITHRTYFFDPITFHTELQEKLISNDSLDLNALLDLAKTIVANATEVTRQALETLRFDEEWLDTSNEEISWTHGWYLIALAQNLRPAPSLSKHFQFGYYILERTLPLLGWTETEVTLLIRGQQLHTLVESSGNNLFITEFVGVDPYGGWLSVENTELLQSHLLVEREKFITPSQELMKAVNDIAEWCGQSPTEMMDKTYKDATEMLQAAINHKRALFILLD